MQEHPEAHLTQDQRDSASRDTAPEEREQQLLAERLRRSREYVGLSQQAVADNTGIPRSAISDIERGVRRVDSIELKRFALVYGQTLEYLLGEDEPPQQSDPTLKMLTRAHAGLTEQDREQLLSYARFLRFHATDSADVRSPGRPDASGGDAGTGELP
ncbi:helix-turn-helix domain-containing protein [Amycolatopsis lurida]